MAKSKNRFDVQVKMDGITFGIKNRADVDLTPEDVARCLEEFCLRIRARDKPVSPLASGAAVTESETK